MGYARFYSLFRRLIPLLRLGYPDRYTAVRNPIIQTLRFDSVLVRWLASLGVVITIIAWGFSNFNLAITSVYFPNSTLILVLNSGLTLLTLLFGYLVTCLIAGRFAIIKFRSKLRTIPFVFFAAIALGCWSILNANPPHAISIDPWLCRSDVGVENVNNWGWPWHVVTEFNEIGDEPHELRRLMIGSLAIPNVIVGILFISIPFILLRGRNSNDVSQNTNANSAV